MTSIWPASCRIAIAAVTLCLLGCAAPSDEVDVHGKVSFRGEPIEGGSIAFFPKSGRSVSASLSSAGEYSAALKPGDYKVTVNVGAILPPGWKEGDPVPPPKVALPREYTTRVRTTLAATIAADQTEALDFALD